MKIGHEVFIVVDEDDNYAEELGTFSDEEEAIDFVFEWETVNGGKYNIKKFIEDD